MGEPTLAEYQASQAKMMSDLIDLWSSPAMLQVSARVGKAAAERFHAAVMREMEEALAPPVVSPGRKSRAGVGLVSWPARRWR